LPLSTALSFTVVADVYQPSLPTVPAVMDVELTGAVPSMVTLPLATAGALPQSSVAVRRQPYVPFGTCAPSSPRRSQVQRRQSPWISVWRTTVPLAFVMSIRASTSSDARKPIEKGYVPTADAGENGASTVQSFGALESRGANVVAFAKPLRAPSRVVKPTTGVPSARAGGSVVTRTFVPAGRVPAGATAPSPASAASAKSGESAVVAAAPGAVRAAGAVPVGRYQVRVTSSVVSEGSYTIER